MGVNTVVYEAERQLKVIGGYDVTVVGAGVAGIAAALASTRNGARVGLIEKGYTPGGLATAGLVAIYLPLCDGAGNHVMGGLCEELLHLSIKYGPGEVPQGWLPENRDKPEYDDLRIKDRFQLQFNPASFTIALEELLTQNNIDIYYDTRVCNVVSSDGRITHLVTENKGGRLAISCSTVVDATGDADICYMAGEKTMSRDDNRRSGWFYSYNEKDVRLHMLTDPLYEPIPKDSRGYSGDDYREVTQNCIDARKMILNKTQKDGEVYYPLLIPSIPQLRMTRRLVGRAELCENQKSVYFDDSIAAVSDWRKVAPIYHLPYRCLIGKTQNLIAAGRCISSDNEVWDVLRSIPCCVASGQAAGTAAASATNGNLTEIDITSLQNLLIKQGVIL